MKNVKLFAALVVSALVLYLHIRRATEAGALWRDEAASVQLATLPSITDVAHYYPHEAFPLLFSIIIRGYSQVTGGTDVAWRIFGAMVGLCIIGALWLNFHLLRRAVPLLSLALLGFSGDFITWGDSIRGYGLGTAAILFTVPLIWHLLDRPTLWRFIGAAAVAICSVQLLFQNAVLLLAICVAAMVVALRARRRQAAASICGVGVAAAVSLLPYWSSLQRAREWDMMIHVPMDFGRFISGLNRALSFSCPACVWIWALIFVGIFALWIVGQFRTAASSESSGARQILMFSAVALTIAFLAYYGFMQVVSHPPQPWHYVALLGLAALLMDLGIDAAISAMAKQSFVGAQIAIVCLLGLLSLPGAWRDVGIRQSNIDVVAQTIARSASTNDLVIVSPWYMGISFKRYYHGAAPWMTIPPIESRDFHRYDQVKDMMTAPNQSAPMKPVVDGMMRVLKNGGRVWTVGIGRLLLRQEVPVLLPPAPTQQFGWGETPYTVAWTGYFLRFLQGTATSMEDVSTGLTQPVTPLEQPPVKVFSRNPQEIDRPR